MPTLSVDDYSPEQLLRIRKLEAGEELDAAVDSYVFGGLHERINGPRPPQRQYSRNTRAAFDALQLGMDGASTITLSTTCRNGFGGINGTFRVEGSGKTWKGESWEADGQGDTVALAICRYLLCIDEDEDEDE